MTGARIGDEQQLRDQLDRALGEQPSGADLVELIIRSGWQPRPTPDPNSDFFEGVLADGTKVPIEIRHTVGRRAG